MEVGGSYMGEVGGSCTKSYRFDSDGDEVNDNRTNDSYLTYVRITVKTQKVESVAIPVIESLAISGRPFIDSKLYQIKKENEQVRHVISVALIQKDIIEKYRGLPLDDIKTSSIRSFFNSLEQKSIPEKMIEVAQQIFKDYAFRVGNNQNLFLGRGDENVGALDLLKKVNLEQKIKNKDFRFSKEFKKSEHAQLIAFLQQTEPLKNLTSGQGDKVVLNVDSWAKLCFLFENTMIDYKVQYPDPDVKLEHYKVQIFKKKIEQGQEIIDRLYKGIGFDTSIRTLENIRVENENKEQHQLGFKKYFQVKRVQPEKEEETGLEDFLAWRRERKKTKTEQNTAEDKENKENLLENQENSRN